MVPKIAETKPTGGGGFPGDNWKGIISDRGIFATSRNSEACCHFLARFDWCGLNG